VVNALSALLALLVVVVVGIAATLPAYGRLLRRLESEEPDVFERLGRPTLFMASPGKSIALQKFLYLEARESSLSPSLERLCRYLAVSTLILVLAVLATVVWLLLASLALVGA
jgi:hypothetical protein